MRRVERILPAFEVGGLKKHAGDHTITGDILHLRTHIEDESSTAGHLPALFLELLVVLRMPPSVRRFTIGTMVTKPRVSVMSSKSSASSSEV